MRTVFLLCQLTFCLILQGREGRKDVVFSDKWLTIIVLRFGSEDTPRTSLIMPNQRYHQLSASGAVSEYSPSSFFCPYSPRSDSFITVPSCGLAQVPFFAFSVLQNYFSSVQSRPILCNPMDHSTPGLPVHHQLPELVQTHVPRVGDAIQASHPLRSPSPPAFSFSQHQGLFQ